MLLKHWLKLSCHDIRQFWVLECFKIWSTPYLARAGFQLELFCKQLVESRHQLLIFFRI